MPLRDAICRVNPRSGTPRVSPPASISVHVRNLTRAGKVTTAAGLGVCVQMRSLAAYSHSRHKEQWVERLTEATRTNFSGALSAMVEYTEGLDVQTPELNLGSCILAVTRLANTMKQHGIY